MPAVSTPTSRSTSPRRSPTRRPRAWSASTRGSRSAASSATSSTTSSGSRTRDGGRLIAFLGGTIGNLYPDARREFLARIAALLGPGDRLLLGTDLVKDAGRLEAAYDDSQGVTAEFNKNVLQVLNRELGADFDLDAFEHVARYDARRRGWTSACARSPPRRVRLDGLDMRLEFAAGEEMRTEISSKFTRERLESIYAEAGLLCGWFTDPARLRPQPGRVLD